MIDNERSVGRSSWWKRRYPADGDRHKLCPNQLYKRKFEFPICLNIEQLPVHDKTYQSIYTFIYRTTINKKPNRLQVVNYLQQGKNITHGWSNNRRILFGLFPFIRPLNLSSYIKKLIDREIFHIHILIYL